MHSVGGSETLGQRIKRLRMRAGLSQNGLGDLLGYTGKSISKWECDKSHPDEAATSNLCHILGTDPEELHRGLVDPGNRISESRNRPGRRETSALKTFMLQDRFNLRDCRNVVAQILLHPTMLFSYTRTRAKASGRALFVQRDEEGHATTTSMWFDAVIFAELINTGLDENVLNIKIETGAAEGLSVGQVLKNCYIDAKTLLKSDRFNRPHTEYGSWWVLYRYVVENRDRLSPQQLNFYCRKKDGSEFVALSNRDERIYHKTGMIPLLPLDEKVIKEGSHL